VKRSHFRDNQKDSRRNKHVGYASQQLKPKNKACLLSIASRKGFNKLLGYHLQRQQQSGKAQQQPAPGKPQTQLSSAGSCTSTCMPALCLGASAPQLSKHFGALSGHTAVCFHRHRYQQARQGWFLLCS